MCMNGNTERDTPEQEGRIRLCHQTFKSSEINSLHQHEEMEQLITCDLPNMVEASGAVA